MDPVLVARTGEYDIAILRDERGYFLGSRRGAGAFGATLIERRVTTMGIPGFTACGGELPAGAVRAVVRGGQAHARDGVWLAVLAGDMREPAVRFEDASGALVADPPSGEPIADATDGCPACGALDWEDARGEIRCRACGHALAAGGMWFPTSKGGGAPKPRRLGGLEDFAGPVYAPPGGEPVVRGMGGTPGALDRVTLAVGDVSVETSRRWYRSSEDAARHELATRYFTGEWPRVSSQARRIWLDARAIERSEAALAAPLRFLEIAVDGRPRMFVFVAVGDDWAAATEGITVRGTGPVPAELVTYRGSAS